VKELLPLSDDIPYDSLGNGKILFERTNEQGVSSFYIIDIDNRKTSGFLLENCKITQPALSPDGEKIACSLLKSGDTNAAWNIYVMNTDGSGHFPAFESDKQSNFPTWNRDGSKIIFYTSGADGKLYSQSPAENATDIEELATFSYAGDPGWVLRPVSGFSVSPEGKMVSVSRSESVSGVISLLPNSGKEGVNLLLAPSPVIYLDAVSSPVFSPDGSKIAFLGTMSDNPGYVNLILNIMNADGSQYTTLGGRGGYVPNLDFTRYLSLCWSPDGTKLLFAMPETDSNCHLYVLKMNGTGFFQVTNLPGMFDYNISWSH
jgi:Tol biopolymer transport system component